MPDKMTPRTVVKSLVFVAAVTILLQPDAIAAAKVCYGVGSVTSSFAGTRTIYRYVIEPYNTICGLFGWARCASYRRASVCYGVSAVTSSSQGTRTRYYYASQAYYTGCGLFAWARCISYRSVHRSATGYQAQYLRRYVTRSFCCPGYRGSPPNCADNNECSSNNGGCSGICHNTAGGFYCTCPSGCTLSSNRRGCNDINECSAGTHTCAHNCHNRGNCGGYYCTCATGYTLDSNGYCPDTNECLNSNGGCAHTCHNTDGSYHCTCNTGYSLISNLHGCQDINECATNNGGCGQVCVNTPGSYHCTCPSGCTLNSNGQDCNDNDECSLGTHNCAHNCNNNISATCGGFYCSCNSGYTLNSDGHSCNDIDECATNNGGCGGTCVNTAGSYYCSCSSGCTLESNGRTCIDINECSAGTDSCAQNCHNNGNCGGFSCSCNSGYTLDSNGHSCNDVNECSSGNGGCAQNCHNTPGGYYCSCNAGYTLASNSHGCNDINECSTGNGGCNQVCINVIGSFQCSCNAGYELDSDQRTCIDTNECGNRNGGCAQICHNTAGSYYCACGTGYTLSSNSHGCNDVNECSTNNGGCNHICTNTAGSFECSCNTGYVLDINRRSCRDVNECANQNGGCGGTCTNIPGSYYCTCPSGCSLHSNGHACIDDNECSAGIDNCAQNCHNSGNCGGFYCSCNSGYTLGSNGHSCNDINECSSSNGGCAQTCHNIMGSYYCTCATGYSLASNSHGCTDINECENAIGGCNHVCTNTIGSFLCSCNAGYELDSDQRTCVDTNECGYNNGGCAQNCHNIIGSYFCTCNTSYTLNANGHTCDDIDECVQNTDLCHHECINTIGSYVCDCNVGYMLEPNGLTCVDVDECATNNGGCDQNCHNTVGSYNCSCNIGFLLDEDNHGCSDHHECDTNNDNCDQHCHNTHGSYYCTCSSGWRLDPDGHTCNETNECREHSSGCTQVCTNTPGSYFCTCYDGYSLDSDNHTCNDINECFTNNGGCEQQCNNTIGSYFCTCNIGFELGNDYHSCPDVNECTTGNGGCQQHCHNMNGSYHCTCDDGWQLDPNGHSCNDTNECEKLSSGCSQTCNNTLGSYFCTCLTGYSLQHDNHTCIDIDECATGNGGCDQDCHNTIGSYYCTCSTGYLLGEDKHTCYDIDECAKSNGGCDQHCHNANGSYHCTCDGGWRLDPDRHTCNDINECSEHTSGCTQICNNTLGGYFCICYTGFSLDLNNHTCTDIVECDTSERRCEQNCTNTVGSYYCTCNVGFQLENDFHGCEDTDECTISNGNCDQHCHNTYGSYHCSCNAGWELSPDKHTCNDINECDGSSSDCSHTCTNTPGSYMCSCNTGYYLDADNHTCRDINECESANGGCAHFCSNDIGTYICYCRNGYDLSANKRGCDAQPCIEVLTAPQNGSISCSGEQVTDQNCSFVCDAGFTLIGSNLRKCLSNNRWTGYNAACTPKHCQPLTNPPNGYVDIAKDCGTVLTTTCEIKCVEGYYINGTTPYYQTCTANQTSGHVYWTKPPYCESIPLCYPNPCLHSGVCTEVNSVNYSCDCSGTHYKGKHCEVGVVTITNIPILTTNQTASILYIMAFPNEFINVTFVVSNILEVTPHSVTITSEEPSIAVNVIARKPGKSWLTYNISGPNAAEFEEPTFYLIVSLDSANTFSSNMYFTDHGRDAGLLYPGCCIPETVTHHCPHSTSDVSFSSSCTWSSGIDNTQLTSGVVFVSGSSISLPLSLVGTKLSSNLFTNALPSLQLTCTDCGGAEPHCYHYDFTADDIASFLLSSALAKTYLHNSLVLMPQWLSLSVANTTLPLDTPFSLSDYQTTLTLGKQVRSVQGCEQLQLDDNGLYTIIKFKKNLTISVNAIKKEYSPAETDLPICLAVNLCNGSLSPVHMTIPASSQDVLASFDQVKQIIDMGGEINFHNAAVSRIGMPLLIELPGSYWNGITTVDPDIPNFDLRLALTMRYKLISENLWISFKFHGNLFHQANPNDSQVEGVLAGEMSLVTNTTVNNDTAHFSMATDSQPAVFSMPGYSNTGIGDGVSFKLQHTAEDGFFKKILPLPENRASCPTDVFVKFSNTTTTDINWMSFTINCSGLYIFDLNFPAGNLYSQVFLTGSSDPPTPDDKWGGATIKVYTSLTTSSLQLNQHLAILQPFSGPALSSGYWRDGKQEGKVYKAAFSLLGAYFTAPAEITDGSLRFHTDAKIFGKYQTHVSGVIVGGRSWNDPLVLVSGELDIGYVKEFQNYTYGQIRRKLDLTEQKIQNADAARNKSREQFELIQEIYYHLLAVKEVAEDEYQQALQKAADAASAVTKAQDKVAAANTSILALNRISAICNQRECNATCMLGATCQSCENQIRFPNWALCEQTVVANKLQYRMATIENQSCVYDHRCRIRTKIKGWGSVAFGQTCSYICSLSTTKTEIEEAYYAAVNVTHTHSCNSTYTVLSVNQSCCIEDPCSHMIPNIDCVYQNTACELAQKFAYSTMNETDKSFASILTELTAVKLNQSIAVASVAAALAKKNLTEQKISLILPAYLSMNQSMVKSNSDYMKILVDEHPILQLKEFVSRYFTEDFMKVEQLKFSTTILEESPSMLPITVSIYIPQLDEAVSTTVSIDLNAPDEIVKRTLFNHIFSTMTIDLFGASPDRSARKRREIEETPSSFQQFATNCAIIATLYNYLSNINQTVDLISVQFEAANKNMTRSVRQFKELVNSTHLNISGVNFTHLENEFGYNRTKIDLEEQVRNSQSLSDIRQVMKSISSETETILQLAEHHMLAQWQATMEAIDTVSGMPCFGFVNCLVIVNDLVQELIEDLPRQNSDRLLAMLAAARQSLLDLSLARSLPFMEIKSKTAPMTYITMEVKAMGYWCNTSPEITKQPETKTFVNGGNTLSISIQANSSLPIEYTWKKNRFILPNYTSNFLVKSKAEVTDEGAYQCLATNVVGTTLSLYSRVTVFESPVIRLSPNDFTTFEGDDNGAVFACNATARPSPNYQWQWSANGNEWTPVINGTSNELLVPKPRMKNAGLYRCQVFTDKASVISIPAKLTILPVTISKLVCQVSFNLHLVQENETIGSGNEPFNYSPTAKPFNKALMSAITKELQLATTKISNLTVLPTLTDVTQISFNLIAGYDLTLNETLAKTSLLAKKHYVNILSDMANLKRMLQNGNTSFIVKDHDYHLDNETAIISNLQYVCQPGYSLEFNNFLCIGCTPGHYQTVINAKVACSVCSIGYYQPQVTSTSCLPCPARHTTIRNGSQTMEDCLTLCQPGYYNATHGVEPCQQCPDQTYQLEFGATVCFPCSESSPMPAACLMNSSYSSSTPYTIVSSVSMAQAQSPTQHVRIQDTQINSTSTAAEVATIGVIFVMVLVSALIIISIRKLIIRKLKPKPKVPEEVYEPGVNDHIWKTNPLYFDMKELEDSDEGDMLDSNTRDFEQHETDLSSPELYKAERNSDQHEAERIISHKQHEAERFGSEQHDEERISPEQNDQERISLEVHDKKRISPVQNDTERISPDQNDKERISPEEHDKNRSSPEQHDEERISPELHDKKRISPELHDKERISPELHEARKIGPQLHESERINLPKLNDEERISPELHGEETSLEKLKTGTSSEKNKAETSSEKHEAESSSGKDKAETSSVKHEAGSSSEKDKTETSSEKNKADATSVKHEAGSSSGKDKAETNSVKHEAESSLRKDKAETSLEEHKAEAISEKHEVESSSGKDKAETSSEKHETEISSEMTEADETGPKCDFEGKAIYFDNCTDNQNNNSDQ